MPAPDPTPATPTVTAHPPERRRSGRPVILPAGCCCTCCCCCCLHTVGGIVGAVVGSTTPIEARPRRMADPNSPFPFRRDEFESEGPIIPAAVLYWLMVASLAGLITAFCTLSQGMGPGGNLGAGILTGVFIAFMALPALQLVASLLSVLVVLIFYPERTLPLQRVGRITWWSFLGTMLGVLLMAGCWGAIAITNR